MHRCILLLALLSVASSCIQAEVVATIDASKQPAPPPRGRGPFPGSALPGLPIKVALVIPSTEIRADGKLLVDFVVTNLGTVAIVVPSSVNQNLEHQTSILTLWLSSDGIKEVYSRDIRTGRLFKNEAVGTSAELYANPDDPQTFTRLAPGKSLLVHADSRVGWNTGRHAIIAHAELVLLQDAVTLIGSAGTADSEPVTTTLSTAGPARR